jgi:hypothetical protein
MFIQNVYYVFLQINVIKDATEGPKAGSPAGLPSEHLILTT